MIHYWRDEPDQMPGLLDEVRPVLEIEGVRRGKHARYHSLRFGWQLAERRHRVDEEVLAEARQALSAAEESGEYASTLGPSWFRLLLAVLRRPRRRRKVAHRCASDGRA